MKIIRHTARDMRQALRAVREQLGEDAVILSSRRTGEGVEITAAIDFEAGTLEAGGFSNAPAATPHPIALPNPAAASSQAVAPTPVARLNPVVSRNSIPASNSSATATAVASPTVVASPSVAAEPNRFVAAASAAAARLVGAVKPTAAGKVAVAPEPAAEVRPAAAQAAEPAFQQIIAAYNLPKDDDSWISDAAREAVAEHVAAPRAPVLPAAAPVLSAAPPLQDEAEIDSFDPVEAIREATLTPLASDEIKATFAEFQTPAAPSPAATEAMGNELKTLRRMLENQLAHLAWNDLARRAPVHTEILRELTEIGISQDLAEHLVRQLPPDTELTFARRFTIAGLSQYLKVTGDHWLDEGGRVAFAGATGVGKTTTLAKIAVRWVLRHGPRDIALVAADAVRLGAQDQLRSLAQLLGVPVYTPEKFESLPSLLTTLNERLVLIDTPGSSVRDPQFASRLAVLSNSASKLETALVLAASTQAGALEEAVKHFSPVNPACCVLTKLDEATSIGGLLSVLIRARLPVSYMSEGQRVPEDLRPARALELVSTAVRLAKARGAAADEDLLRRRFGKTAHGIS